MKVVLLIVALSFAARAEDEEPVRASVTGYLEGRAQYTRAQTGGPVPTRDLPELQGILELDTQIKRALFSDAHGFFLDTSFFFQRGGLFYEDRGGERTRVGQHPVAALRPSLVLQESYLSLGLHENFHVTLGKKRVVWGTGQAWNPTDLVNPPKDLTDPGAERGGAWLLRLEAPFESWTATVLFAPAVTSAAAGLPYNFLYHPSYARLDGQPHFLAAARLYTLFMDADVSLYYFFDNLYADAFDHKSRVGFSFSRYFFTEYELHVEALLQTGSPRLYAEPTCTADEAALARCLSRRVPVLAASEVDAGALRPRVLVGTRYMFSDESMLSLEYLFQGDGFSRAELSDYVAALYGVQKLAAALPALGVADAQPKRFRQELLRKHYLFASWQKPRIRDDFTVSAVLLASLADLSGLLSAQLAWSVREWVTLQLGAYVPFSGPAALGTLARGPIEAGLTDYALLPMAWRAIFTTRFFY